MKTVKSIVFQSERSIGIMPDVADIRDLSRFGNNGVGANVTYNRLPSRLYVKRMNGSTSRIIVPSLPSLDFKKNICSFSFWAKFNSFPAPGQLEYLYSKGELATSSGWAIIVDGVNPYVQVLIGNGVSMPSAWSLPLRTGEWNHFSGTFDGRYERMYQNAVLTRNTDMGAMITIASSANDFYIGCRADLSAATFVDADLTLETFYDFTLTAGQVLNLFESECRWFGK
jgi:hypothetical protein